MKKFFIDILADGSYRDMSPDELRKLTYGARYYSYQGTEADTHGLTCEEFYARREEILALIDAAERAPKPAPTVTPQQERMAKLRQERQARRVGTDQPCARCGQPATMNASLGPSCPECYDALSG